MFSCVFFWIAATDNWLECEGLAVKLEAHGPSEFEFPLPQIVKIVNLPLTSGKLT